MRKLLIEQGSEAWFQAKLGLFTGTRFKTVVSGKSTSGYKNLITEIAGEILTGEREECFTNETMQRGIDLEPEAAMYFSDEFGVDLEEVGLILPDEGNEFAQWIGVSPDRIMGDIGLEIKCPLIKAHLNYIKGGKLPNEHKWQVQGSLYVTGFKSWYFMSYFPGLKPFIIEVLPDKVIHMELEQRLREAIKEVELEIKSYQNYIPVIS